MASDLVAFLAARLDEDEAAAREATAGPWEWEQEIKDPAEWGDDGLHLVSKAVTWMDSGGGGPHPTVVLSGWGHDAWGLNVEDGDKAHIARHDPARVLRDVAAKRAILAEYKESLQFPYDLPEGIADGRDDDERERDAYLIDLLDGVVRHLAAVYSGHPGYREEWKP
jgi:hypothetical protein